MREIIQNLQKKGKKFIVAYLVCAVMYAIFEYLYMPWLTLKFGVWMFVPLYPSILFANFLGLYLYDWLGEDVLFIEFGSNLIQQEGGKLEGLKKFLRGSRKKIFVALSIWPSPIASYLFFRKEKNESAIKVFKNIALGSVFCTIAWGGVCGLLWVVVVKITEMIK